MSETPVVAVLNTSQDVITMLVEILEDDGFQVVADYIVPYRQGEKDLRVFFAQHQPRAVIYDVAPPYQDNWMFFHTARQLSGLPDTAFVLTTTNKAQLDAIAGTTQSYEFVGKPFDLAQILDAVRRAINTTDQ